MVADVDALQNLHLRGVGPPLVALLAGAVSVGAAAAFLPAAGAVLAMGLLAAGIAVPALAGVLGRRAGQRQAAHRGALSTELVELLDAAPELLAHGADVAALSRVEEADRALVNTSRRDALAGGLADGVGLLVAGVTVGGVLALAVGAHADGELDRVLIAMLALLALASFEAVQPALRSGARATCHSRRRPEGPRAHRSRARRTDPPRPAAAPSAPFELALENVSARYPYEPGLALDGGSLRLGAKRTRRASWAQRRWQDTVVNPLLRFLDPESRPRDSWGGRDLRDYRQEDAPPHDRRRRTGLPPLLGEHS